MPASIHLLVPITAYQRLMADCNPASAEYKLLTNGVIEIDTAGARRVRILCDDARCEQIFTFVRRARPELAHVIDRVVFASNASPH